MRGRTASEPATRRGPRAALGMSLLAAGLFTGCGGAPREEATPEETTPEEATPYRAALDMHQLMSWVLDPSADVIWASAGSVITEAGEQDLAPVDEEGWAAVRNAAAVVAESGNLLMLPGRARGSDWVEFSGALVGMGERAIMAAEQHDADALFEIGGRIYNVCVACHQLYLEPEAEAESP